MTSSANVLSRGLLGFTLACITISASAQTEVVDTKQADTKVVDSKPTHVADPVHGPEVYQTFFLKNTTPHAQLNEIQTAVRNLLPKAKLYAVPSQNALSMRGSEDDITFAQKLIADLDRSTKLYRLTYTLTESDNGKRIGIQHFAMVVESGEKSEMKQGSRVPISKSGDQFQYIDVDLHIEASIDGYADGVRLSSKVDQSSLAPEEKSGATEHPVIRQTTLEGSSILINGKPIVLGSLDIPGSTRHQEIEVVSELIR